uniref:BZIP domain-containing protein n=1 Tax=Strongyloides papillosus TaxID=174720 RepID=A0A0N5B8Y0_STREA
MARTYVPDCEKDSAYYKRRSNNAASVKLFREKKRKAEEEHNRKIMILREKAKELVESIQILTRQFQYTVNNLNFNYLASLNNIYVTCNRDILRQIEILKTIVYDIPELKTRNYGLKRLGNDNDSGNKCNNQNEDPVELSCKCVKNTIDNKDFKSDVNEISLKN